MKPTSPAQGDPPARPHRILLVPTDLDATSSALPVALALARELRAEVVLAHVYRVPHYAYPSGDLVYIPRLQEEFVQATRRSLEELSTRAGGLRTVLREGEPATRILELIDELQPWMVVMGTHGRRGLARLMLGSITERVVRRSPCPVLTVRLPAGATTRTAA